MVAQNVEVWLKEDGKNDRLVGAYSIDPRLLKGRKFQFKVVEMLDLMTGRRDVTEEPIRRDVAIDVGHRQRFISRIDVERGFATTRDIPPYAEQIEDFMREGVTYRWPTLVATPENFEDVFDDPRFTPH